MQILIAEFAGFCEGVSAAYKKARAHHDVFMLGNLVHNTQVVDKLKQQGIEVIKDLKEIKNGATLLISAHGVSPNIYKEAQDKNLEVVDTTCSWVKRAQKLAKELIEQDYQLIIVGDKNHPEVKGIVGWSNDQGLVVSNKDELTSLQLKDRVGVIAQTTQSESNFADIVSTLQNSSKDLVVHKTICGATQKRQKAAIDLARKVELILIIGDKMSANTKRLTELCAQAGTETHQIQTAKELNLAWFKGKKTIGLTAGASTPDWVIKNVVAKLALPGTQIAK